MIPTPDDASATSSPEAPEERSAERRHIRRHHARDRRRRYITAGLAVALCSLLVNAIVGDNGYLAAMRLRAEEAGLRAAVATLRLENRKFRQDASRLREDPSALEEAARGELGLIRPGETVVVVRDAAPAGGANTGR